MLEKITINALGQTKPHVEDGSLVILKESKFSSIGILRTDSKVEIENLIDLTSQHLALLKGLDNGVYSLTVSDLSKLQTRDKSLKIERNLNTLEEDENNIVFLLDEGMLIIGHRKNVNGAPTVCPISELSFYRKSIYTFLEASFPDDIEAERQFLYECPTFFYEKFKPLIKLR